MSAETCAFVSIFGYCLQSWETRCQESQPSKPVKLPCSLISHFPLSPTPSHLSLPPQTVTEAVSTTLSPHISMLCSSAPKKLRGLRGSKDGGIEEDHTFSAYVRYLVPLSLIQPFLAFLLQFVSKSPAVTVIPQDNPSFQKVVCVTGMASTWWLRGLF